MRGSKIKNSLLKRLTKEAIENERRNFLEDIRDDLIVNSLILKSKEGRNDEGKEKTKP